MINFFLHIFDVLQKRRSLARWLLAGITVILMAMMASAWLPNSISIRILLSGLNPGRTLDAWKSSKSLPPNSR